jgi:NitT/TauT family transport system substrate-binding protein
VHTRSSDPVPSSSQAVIADQLEGRVDISAGSYIAYISAQAAGARFRILAEASMLRPDSRVLVTTARSPIVAVGQLAGKTIAVNATKSIGTLLISVLLSDHGISPARVRFITDQQGFPAMPAQLQAGGWNAAFLASQALGVRAVHQQRAAPLRRDRDIPLRAPG